MLQSIMGSGSPRQQAPIRIAPYSPLIYANLPEFSIAKSLLEHCKDHIPALGDIIRAYTLHDAVGVTLLHKHFNLLEDEILLRSITNNQMHVRPTARAQAGLCPYMWAFGKTRVNEPFALYPMDFVCVDETKSHFQRCSNLVEANIGFLQAFFVGLSSRGLTNIFGLGLLPKCAFTMADEDTLIETDDYAARQLTVNVAPAATLEGINSTQTLWTFNS